MHISQKSLQRQAKIISVFHFTATFCHGLFVEEETHLLESPAQDTLNHVIRSLDMDTGLLDPWSGRKQHIRHILPLVVKYG